MSPAGRTQQKCRPAGTVQTDAQLMPEPRPRSRPSRAQTMAPGALEKRLPKEHSGGVCSGLSPLTGFMPFLQPPIPEANSEAGYYALPRSSVCYPKEFNVHLFLWENQRLTWLPFELRLLKIPFFCSKSFPDFERSC